MNNKKQGFIIGFFILLMSLSAGLYAQDVPVRPNPPKLVNDLAGVLGAAEVQELERSLVAFNDTTSTQIMVLTVPSLNGYDPASFATKIGEQWGVGQKGKNNGIIVLVKPKLNARDKGQVFISVGYGLEGVVPDAIANRISDNEMIPYFKNNDYYGGITAGTNILKSLTAGEYSAEDYQKQSEGSPLFALGLFLFMAFFFILVMAKGKRQRSGYTLGSSAAASSMPWWLMMGGSSFGGRSSSGSSSWSDFSSGGGSFGGFGGGSFGGGGAGGSW